MKDLNVTKNDSEMLFEAMQQVHENLPTDDRGDWRGRAAEDAAAAAAREKEWADAAAKADEKPGEPVPVDSAPVPPETAPASPETAPADAETEPVEYPSFTYLTNDGTFNYYVGDDKSHWRQDINDGAVYRLQDGGDPKNEAEWGTPYDNPPEMPPPTDAVSEPDTPPVVDTPPEGDATPPVMDEPESKPEAGAPYEPGAAASAADAAGGLAGQFVQGLKGGWDRGNREGLGYRLGRGITRGGRRLGRRLARTYTGGLYSGGDDDRLGGYSKSELRDADKYGVDLDGDPVYTDVLSFADGLSDYDRERLGYAILNRGGRRRGKKDDDIDPTKTLGGMGDTEAPKP